jgi:glutathione S-transferase
MLRGMALKLFGHDTSPYVRRVRVLLAEKALPFTRDTDSWTVPTAEVLRINPILRVPVLLDTEAQEGRPQYLLDSKLIATYLYDRYPGTPASLAPPIQPTLFHPAHRYDDDNLLLSLDAALDSAINIFLFEQSGVPREKVPYLLRQSERIKRCLESIDERLAHGTTFHEGVFGFLDIALTCALDWFLFRQRYPVGEHRNLTRFLEAHRQRPTLAATHPSLAQNPAPPSFSPR